MTDTITAPTQAGDDPAISSQPGTKHWWDDSPHLSIKDKAFFSSQPGTKSGKKRGRPRKLVSVRHQAATFPEALTVGGKSGMHRSAQISDWTFPEAKDAARSANLQNNMTAMLMVAHEPTLEAQLAKVAEIAARGGVATPPKNDTNLLNDIIRAFNRAPDHVRRAFVKSAVEGGWYQV